MRILILFASIFTLFTLFACQKEKYETMTVVRDCTGTYLRFNEKDYHVCNLEKVSSFANGTEVSANFKKIEECNGSAKNSIVCMFLHANEGWITVNEIK